jgi:GNAT superfamily N-acetyltransferase
LRGYFSFSIQGNERSLIVRPYQPTDRPAVRRIYGDDEFARPKLQERFPRMSTYLTDSMMHYYDLEPERIFIAEADGEVVGALLGAIDTERTERRYHRKVKPLLLKRTLSGTYGWPAWLWADWLTHLAGLRIETPEVDLTQYPAHLHVGVLPDWRRMGAGSALMTAYESTLRSLNIPGYHLYASSFHPMGVAFYQKTGLEIIGQFKWRFHTGFDWIDVLETIFAKKLGESEKK